MRFLVLLFSMVLFATATRRTKRQTVGQTCFQSTDCGGNGAYCNSNQRCSCLSNYVDVGGYCFAKMNPGDAGCSNSLQCSAVWPDAFCSSGTCRCANNQPGFLTRDGVICVNYGQCPTNGAYTAYPEGSCGSSGAATDVLCDDTYDCICRDSTCQSLGICCPSRALACIMAMDSGTGSIGGGSTSRFYFDSISRTCKSFFFAGAGGNANNFYTLQQCESYCLDHCERGQPEYSSTITVLNNKGAFEARTCSLGNTITCSSPNFQCTTIGTQGLCCPQTSYVCSQNGGRPYTNNFVPSTPYDPGETYPDGRVSSVSRFYYDVNEKRCKSFSFTGLGGNYNNFLSLSSCESYCSNSVCEYGRPLTDSSGSNQVCGICPAGYSCMSSVCCPTSQTVCSRPIERGPCFNYVSRWYFNSQTGNCQTFEYGGCQGNDNNFLTYSDCASTCQGVTVRPQCPQGDSYTDSNNGYLICGGPSATTNYCPSSYYCYFDGSTYGCCPTKTYTCAQSYDSGTACKAAVTRYYYNNVNRRCETFDYFGCNGNSNNFATQQDCGEYCGVGGCPYGGTPFATTAGYQSCGTSSSPYNQPATCQAGYFCAPVTLVQGTVTTTNNYCCPTRSSVCQLPRNDGSVCTTSTTQRWYFSTATKTCQQFNYGGCNGNRNNFATQTQCQGYCNSADCPDGEVALTDANGNLQTCYGGQSCGGNGQYACVQSAIFGRSICCGSNAPAGTCPAGYAPWIDALTNTPQTCTPNTVGECNNGYACLYSSTRQQYFCCGTPASSVCPQGGTPYTYPGSGQTVACNPTQPSSCASLGTQYQCQARTVQLNPITSTAGTCCAPETVNTVCGNGYTPYKPLTNPNAGPQRCNPITANICPSPSSCRPDSNGVSGMYYCCVSTGTETNVCPVNYSPLIYNQQSPVLCSSQAPCQQPYQCLQSPVNGRYYCCRTGGSSSGVCQNGQPYLTGSQGCSPSPNTCQGGYTCQYVPTASQYVCCPSGIIQTTVSPVGEPCPAPYTSPRPTGYPQPMGCVASQNSCPSQYFCVSTIRGNYCCGLPQQVTNPPISDPQGCPNGMTYIPYGATTLPLSCTGASHCPDGGSCQNSSKPGNGQICCRYTSG